MRIEYRDGLIFTSIEILYEGNTKTIDNVVIDTGAAGSIISSDAVDDIGIYAELGDKIIEYYGVGGSSHIAYIKRINEIKLGSQSIKDIEIDFGMIDTTGDINGLIGLDILIKVGAIIDLKNFNIDISWISHLIKSKEGAKMLNVVAAVLKNNDNNILISKRQHEKAWLISGIPWW